MKKIKENLEEEIEKIIVDDIETNDIIIYDEEEDIDVSDLDDDDLDIDNFSLSKHKIEGKHALKYDTIFKGKDLRFIYNENKIDNSIVRYSDANTIDCYSYNEDLIEPSKNEDIFLKGYFQNEKYFEHCKNDIIRLFKNEKIMNDLLIKYTKTKESFFIHYRRGDFVKYFYDLYIRLLYLNFSKAPAIHLISM